MTIEQLLPRLDGVRRTSQGYVARCPAHQDRNPSLSIGEGASRILLHCFALCENQAIVAALGIRMADLFFSKSIFHGHWSASIPVKVDRIPLAFRFELAALDRWLRAERVNNAVSNMSIHELNDTDIDRLIKAVGSVHADIERAKLFEELADGLRLKEFAQRGTRHAA